MTREKRLDGVNLVEFLKKQEADLWSSLGKATDKSG